MNKYIFGLIISTVFVFTALVGWGFLASRNVSAEVRWCYQCKCTYDGGIHIKSAGFKPDYPENQTCNDALCQTQLGPGWPNIDPNQQTALQHKPECDNNCTSQCIDSIDSGGGGGSSCTLSSKNPPQPNDSCSACVITNWRGAIDAVKREANNNSCSDLEVLSHLCNGGVNYGQSKSDCESWKKNQCASACGFAAASPTPTPTPTPGTGTGVNISGRVTDAKTGAGIPNVTLNQTACLQPPMTTNSSGYFQATNVPVGTWFCLRPPAIAPGGYTNPATSNTLGIYPPGSPTYECQQAGGLYDTSACSSPSVDLTADNAYNFTYTSTSSTGSPTPTPTNTPNTPTPTPTTKTSFYRISDKLFQKGDTGPEWLDYTAEPIAFDYLFKDAKVGDTLTLFVQFQADNGATSAVFQKSIKYIGADPKITSISCQYNASGVGTSITIKGTNLGGEQGNGTVTLPTEKLDADVLSWGDDELPPISTPSVIPSTSPSVTGASIPPSVTSTPTLTSTPTITSTPTSTPTPTCILRPACLDLGRLACKMPEPVEGWCPASVLGASVVKSKIVAKVDTKLTEGRHLIKVTRDDGKMAEGTCNIGLTTVDFIQKTACLARSADLSEDNVAVDIKEKVDKAKAIFSKKIKINAEGRPVDFTPPLEIGKTYVLSIRAPKTVSRKVEFLAEEGTTNLDDIILPVGDIYPISSPDNKVNAFDKAEMSREWSLVTDVTRPADLNMDSRVNSVDYSCLQNNYNKSGD